CRQCSRNKCWSSRTRSWMASLVGSSLVAAGNPHCEAYPWLRSASSVEKGFVLKSFSEVRLDVLLLETVDKVFTCCLSLCLPTVTSVRGYPLACRYAYVRLLRPEDCSILTGTLAQDRSLPKGLQPYPSLIALVRRLPRVGQSDNQTYQIWKVFGFCF